MIISVVGCVRNTEILRWGGLVYLLTWYAALLPQVSCDFCRETYTFGEAEVLDALPAEA